MKKFLLVAIFCMFCITNAYAVQPPGFGSVLDVNDGDKGDILVNTGNDRGISDVGKWVDSSFLKGEQGERGRRGKKGKTGSTGEQGDDGNDGQAGESGSNGEQGNDGKEGVKGKQGVQGLQGKGLKKRVEVIAEIRLWDKRKHAGFIYGGADINNNVGIVGVKFQYKFGKSYEETLIENMNVKLEEVLSYYKLEQEINLGYANENYDIKVMPNGSTLITQKINF